MFEYLSDVKIQKDYLLGETIILPFDIKGDLKNQDSKYKLRLGPNKSLVNNEQILNVKSEAILDE